MLVLVKFLIEYGFSQDCELDKKFFYHKSAAGTIILATHVDDMPHVASNPAILQNFHNAISIKWDCKFPSQGFCLGVNILHDRSKREISLCQSVYISKLVERFLPQGYKAESDLLLPIKNPSSPDSPECNKSQKHTFQQIVGSALYASTHTRHDIGHAVCYLSRRMQHPSIADLG